MAGDTILVGAMGDSTPDPVTGDLRSDHGSVYIFRLATPATEINLSGVQASNSGTLLIVFTNVPGAPFTVLATTNPAQPRSNWTSLGSVIEVSPGQFQFTDPEANNHPHRFYRVCSP